jgi:hypothetical protein
MRAALELIVRPFVVSQVTSPKQPDVGATPTTTQSNIVIDIGSDSVTSWSGNFNQDVSFYFIKKPKEKKKAGDGGNYFGPNEDPLILDPLVLEPPPP